MNKSALGSMMLCVSLLMLYALAIPPAHALPANSMWIEPPPLNLSIVPSGTKFNITIWLNMTTPTKSWQFYLTYNPDFLNATRCGYTGDDKSLWSGDQPIFGVASGFGAYRGYGYVTHGENLRGKGTMTGAGSLSWVEFNLTQGADHSMLGQLRLDIPGVFKSLALDKNLTDISLTFGLVNIAPEFPLSSLLVASLAVTTCIGTVFRRLNKKAHA